MKKRKKKKSSFGQKIKKQLHKFKEVMFEEEEGTVSKSYFSIFEVMVIMIISTLFGLVMGYIITYSRVPIQSKAHTNLREIVSTYNNILDNYYGEVESEELANAAIKGMVESLNDPYSNFMDVDAASQFNETVDGSFVGIGVVVAFEGDQYTIIEVMDSSPAKDAGLEVGDIFIKIGNKDVASLTGDEFLSEVRGKVGTNVVVTVRRGEEEKKFTLTRSKIELKSVSNKVINQDDQVVGYIKIDSFAANTASQFQKALKRLEKKNIDSLVIDLRGNPGGHLEQTREMLSLFFPKKTILYQIDKKGNYQKIYSQSSEVRKYPVVILIDHDSASASEIFASCFQENYKKGVIVGVSSYGKGTVQTSQSLSSGTSIKYTTQKWLTASGKWLNEVGVEPDFVVEQSQEYKENPTIKNDIQLQTALEQLKES